MSAIQCVRSFEGLRRRATRVPFGTANLAVASLADIIKSKKAAGRPKDLAVLHVLENALAQAAHHTEEKARNSQEGK
jgi:hypothetical protein